MITFADACNYELGSCSLFMNLFYELFPDLLRKKVERKYKRYQMWMELRTLTDMPNEEENN